MDRNKNRNASVIFSYSPRISKTVEVSSVWAGGWWESTSRAQRREKWEGRSGSPGNTISYFSYSPRISPALSVHTLYTLLLLSVLRALAFCYVKLLSYAQDRKHRTRLKRESIEQGYIK